MTSGLDDLEMRRRAALVDVQRCVARSTDHVMRSRRRIAECARAQVELTARLQSAGRDQRSGRDLGVARTATEVLTVGELALLGEAAALLARLHGDQSPLPHACDVAGLGCAVITALLETLLPGSI